MNLFPETSSLVLLYTSFTLYLAISWLWVTGLAQGPSREQTQSQTSKALDHVRHGPCGLFQRESNWALDIEHMDSNAS